MDEKEGKAEQEVESARWTPDRVAQLRCVVRDDGKKSHLFLDHSNRCECGDVDLNTYRNLELR